MSKQKRPVDHGDKESRLRKACERLATDSPGCIFGDQKNPLCLELHHVAKREFDEETLQICSNHHDRVSDAMKDHPPKIDGCTSPLEGLGHFILGLAELVAIAAEDIGEHPFREFLVYLDSKLKEIGLRLIEMARATAVNKSGGVS